MKIPVEKEMTWEEWTKTSLHFQLLHGGNLHWVRETRELLVSLPQIVLITGPFGVGKSYLFSRLENVRKHTKKTARAPRLEEISGSLPFRELDYRKMFFEREPAFVSLIMGLDWPHPRWNDWGRRLNIIPPTMEDISNNPCIIGELTSYFPINDFITDLQEADDKDVALGLELSPVHLFDWLNLLEMIVKDKRLLQKRIRIIALQSDPEIIVDRLNKREINKPKNDFVKRARILESVSTPQWPLPSRYQFLSFVNNTNNDKKMIEMVERFVAN